MSKVITLTTDRIFVKYFKCESMAKETMLLHAKPSSL